MAQPGSLQALVASSSFAQRVIAHHLIAADPITDTVAAERLPGLVSEVLAALAAAHGACPAR
jgi:hypothetical protein